MARATGYPKIMNTDQQQLERMVAYLDGELSAEESAQVEQQLASDEQFRQALQGAERAWRALDDLPMSHVGDEFAKTTMDMVVDAARHDVEAKTMALPIQQRKKKTTTVVMVAMAFLLGALTFRVLASASNRRLVADLPVIQYVDIYAQIKEVSFLRELQRGLGDRLEASTAKADQFSDSIAEFQLVADASQRASWLEALPSEEQVNLRAKFNRFRDLSPPQKEGLRELHQQIESAEDREQVLLTLFRYQQWLKELPPSRQYEYRTLEGGERLRRIANELERTASERQFELTDEQVREVFMQVRPQIEQVFERNKPAFREFYSRRSPQEQRDFRSLPRPEQMKRVFQFAMVRSSDQMTNIVETIAEALPEEMVVAFQELRPGEKRDRVQAWIRQFHASMREGGRMGRISAAELADFFVELPTEAKERLLARRPEDMQRLLEDMYRGKWRSSRRGRPPGMDRRGPRDGGPRDGGPRDGGPRDGKLREGGPPDGPRRDRFDERRGPALGPPGGRRRFDEDRGGPLESGPRRGDMRRPRRPEGPPPEQG
ncbi:MAG: anti-sigma factor family protein [Bythopirellula sp.]